METTIVPLLKRFLSTILAGMLAASTTPVVGVLGVTVSTRGHVEQNLRLKLGAQEAAGDRKMHARIALSGTGSTSSGSSFTGRENRCKHIPPGEDRERCLRNAQQHPTESHGRFMKQFRHTLKDEKMGMKEETKAALREARVLFQTLMTRLRLALMKSLEASVKVCEENTGEEGRKCILDASMGLRAKVEAALRALAGS